MALSTESRSSVNLNFGLWEIRVVGWDNSPSVSAFEGDVLCGFEKVDFSKEDQTVQIKVANSKCTDSAFAGPSYVSTATQVTFTPVPIYTCGALFASDGKTLRTPDSLTEAFCQDYPDYMEKSAKALTFTLHNKLPSGSPVPGLTSECLLTSETAEGKPVLHMKRIPTKIPLQITLFEDETCTRPSGEYFFSKGLEKHDRTQGFDAILSPRPMLALATPISKRGTTPFNTETPVFGCGSNVTDYCLKLPQLPDGIEFVIQSGGSSSIEFERDLDCNTFSSATISGQAILTKNHCYNQNGRTFLKLDHNGSLDDTSFTLENVQYDVKPVHHLWHYKNLRQILGVNKQSGDITASMGENNGEGQDEFHGSMGEIAQRFSPALIGGLFWDQTCSNSPLSQPVKRTVTIHEDGKKKTFMVILTNPPSQMTPRYILNQNPRNLTDGSGFHRRIILREFKDIYGYVTQNVMDIACDGVDALDLSASTANLRRGRAEDRWEEFDGNVKKTEKTLTLWNTTYIHNSRFETYRTEKKEDIVNNLLHRESSSYTRAEKFPSSANSERDMKIVNLSYNFERSDSGTPDLPNDDKTFERLHHTQYDIQGTQITVHQSPELKLENFEPGKIFSDEILAGEKDKIRYERNNQAQVLKVHPNGSFFHVYRDGNQLQFEHFDGNAYFIHSYQGSAEWIDGDISPDGTRAVIVSSSISELKVHTFNGQQWNTSPVLPTSTTTIGYAQKITATILNDGNFVVAGIFNQQLFIGNGSINNPSPSLSLVSTQDSIGVLFEDVILSRSKANGDTFKIWLMAKGKDATTKGLFFCQLPDYCELSKVWNLTGVNESLEDLTFSVDDTSTNIVISWRQGNGNSYQYVSALNFDLPTISDVIQGPSLYRPTPFNIDMANIITPYQELTSIPVPYVAPAAPGFQMNFRSLRPSHMSETVFKNSDHFKSIGDGL
jgi:hypothetical protein